MAFVAAVLFVVALMACLGDPTIDPSGGNTDGAATTLAALPSDVASFLDPSPTGGLTPSENPDAITASDVDAPEITIPAPWAINSTQMKVLCDSSSAQVVGTNSTVTVNYVGVSGRIGAVFDSPFQRGKEATFSMRGVIAGFKNGPTGQKVGSRVLIGMTGADGYVQGNPQAGIQVGDSLVFVIDIIAASCDGATGEAAIPAAGLPTVTTTGGRPEVTLPGGGVNAEQLVMQPLIKGPGKMIEADSTILVRYRTWEVKSGKTILDGWRGAQSDKPSTPINGWKTGLLGWIAGPRVTLAVSSVDSSPNGESSKGLEAGEGPVYVIDILDVKAASQQNWRDRPLSR